MTSFLLRHPLSSDQGPLAGDLPLDMTGKPSSGMPLMAAASSLPSHWPDPFAIELTQGDLVTQGTRLERITVRAIVLRGDQLLLVHSSVNGDLMFPGGGIEAGECHTRALARELREECGAELVEVGALLGETREYRAARERHYDLYCIRSFYYLCRVGEGWCEPQPQPYEIRLGFTPGWFGLADALQTNKTRLAGPAPQWTARETRVLAQLQCWYDAGVLA